MPTLNVINAKAQVVGSVQLSDEVFAAEGSSHVVWEVVRQHLANQRRGTHATKTRGDVSGGGRKPWRQKGTGRARVGSSRNPLWRHGGITQGPQPRDYSFSVPKSKRRAAVCRVLSSLVKENRVTVLDSLTVSEPKTRAFRTLLAGTGAPPRALVLVEKADENLVRASSNLADVKVVQPEAVNAYDLLRHRHLVATQGALSRLQEVLAR